MKRACWLIGLVRAFADQDARVPAPIASALETQAHFGATQAQEEHVQHEAGERESLVGTEQPPLYLQQQQHQQYQPEQTQQQQQQNVQHQYQQEVPQQQEVQYQPQQHQDTQYQHQQEQVHQVQYQPQQDAQHQQQQEVQNQQHQYQPQYQGAQQQDLQHQQHQQHQQQQQDAQHQQQQQYQQDVQHQQQQYQQDVQHQQQQQDVQHQQYQQDVQQHQQQQDVQHQQQQQYQQDVQHQQQQQDVQHQQHQQDVQHQQQQQYQQDVQYQQQQDEHSQQHENQVHRGQRFLQQNGQGFGQQHEVQGGQQQQEAQHYHPQQQQELHHSQQQQGGQVQEQQQQQHGASQEEIRRQQADAERVQHEREEEDKQESLWKLEQQKKERQEAELKKQQEEEAEFRKQQEVEQQRIEAYAAQVLETQLKEAKEQRRKVEAELEIKAQQEKEAEEQGELAKREQEQAHRRREEQMQQQAREEQQEKEREQQEQRQQQQQQEQQEQRKREEEEEDNREQRRLYDIQQEAIRVREAKKAQAKEDADKAAEEEVEFRLYQQQFQEQEKQAKQRPVQQQQHQQQFAHPGSNQHVEETEQQHDAHSTGPRRRNIHKQVEEGNHAQQQQQQQQHQQQQQTTQPGANSFKAPAESSARSLPIANAQVYARLLHVVFHFTAATDVAAVLSLANGLMNRGHKVSYAGQTSILQKVMDLTSVEDDSQFFFTEDMTPIIGLSEEQYLYSVLPKALTPILAQLAWYNADQTSFESLRQQLSNAKQMIDVVVTDSFASSCMDVAESLGMRPVVLHSAPLDWIQPAKTSHALPFTERLVSEVWNALSPFIRLLPTAFVNYQRFSRGLPLLCDVQDYWTRSINWVTQPASLPPNFRAVDTMPRFEHLSPNDTKVLDFISAREEQGLPIVYVNFGNTWLRPKLVEAILWGLIDSRWAVVMNIPAEVEATLEKDNLPPDRRGNKYILTALSAHIKVLQHRNVKVFLSHGGAELMNAVLMNGLPSFLVPLTAAQAQQALSLQQQGAAIVATTDRQLTSTVAESVWRLMNEPVTRVRAEKLGMALLHRSDASAFLERAMSGDIFDLLSEELDLPFWRRWNLDVWGCFLMIFLPVWFVIGALGELFASCWDLCCPRICCCLCCSFKPKASRRSKQQTRSNIKLPPIDLAAKKLQ